MADTNGHSWGTAEMPHTWRICVYRQASILDLEALLIHSALTGGSDKKLTHIVVHGGLHDRHQHREADIQRSLIRLRDWANAHWLHLLFVGTPRTPGISHAEWENIQKISLMAKEILTEEHWLPENNAQQTRVWPQDKTQRLYDWYTSNVYIQRVRLFLARRSL
jgi:hypothetical protein